MTSSPISRPPSTASNRTYFSPSGSAGPAPPPIVDFAALIRSCRNTVRAAFRAFWVRGLRRPVGMRVQTATAPAHIPRAIALGSRIADAALGVVREGQKLYMARIDFAGILKLVERLEVLAVADVGPAQGELALNDGHVQEGAPGENGIGRQMVEGGEPGGESGVAQCAGCDGAERFQRSRKDPDAATKVDRRALRPSLSFHVGGVEGRNLLEGCAGVGEIPLPVQSHRSLEGRWFPAHGRTPACAEHENHTHPDQR